MKIALIAHDSKKGLMIEFAKKHEKFLKQHSLIATGTTGARIMENTSLEIHRVRSGPLGGDQEIGARVANQEVDLVIFLRDPLASQPHEPDITALLRLCDVYKVPLATNETTAHLLLIAHTKEC